MTKVTLRKKALKDGRLSLYLDFYPAIPHPQSGKPSRREFLKLYLLATPRTALEREQNKLTQGQAKQICAQRQVQVHQGQYQFLVNKESKMSLLVYFEQLAAARKNEQAPAYAALWQAVYARLKAFSASDLPLERVDKRFCEAFRRYLLTDGALSLSKRSAQTYFMIFKIVVKAAYEEGLLESNPASRVSRIKTTAASRSFLTLEELQALEQTDCKHTRLKRISLFSALTGLRYSDLRQLTWENVHYSKSVGHQLRFRQQKTGSEETLPISAAARALLGEEGTGVVFSKLPPNLSQNYNKALQAWVDRAGIKKKITFHCFRHSFATLQLTLGVDIYTVSKMLGHRSVQTTQIYGRIVDEKKRAAAEQLSEAWHGAAKTTTP